MKITQAVTADIPELCILLDSLFTQEVEFESNHEAQVRGLNTVINSQEIQKTRSSAKSIKFI